MIIEVEKERDGKKRKPQAVEGQATLGRYQGSLSINMIYHIVIVI